VTSEEIVLIAVATILIGTADFFGGVASRSASAITVAAWSQALGVPVIAVAAVLIGGSLTGRDSALGMAAGLGSALGVAALYRGFAVSVVGIVAPVAATAAAVLPIVVGLAIGEQPATTVLIGIGCAVVAVFLVGYVPGARLQTPAVLHGVGSGVGFAVMGITYAGTSSESGVWSAVIGRATAALVAGVVVIATGAGLVLVRNARMPTALSGVLAATGMAAFVTVSQIADLVILGVALGLFPVVTVLLAAVFLRERLAFTQWLGVGLAAVAVALINAGGS
jgi:drug/metabolite transporter (DMT)-like permease